MTKIHNDNKGLTLIETAVVLVIGGLLMTMLFSTMNVYLKNKKLNETKAKIALIDDQIQKYLRQNASLPCVARPAAAPETAEFGVEFNANCNGMPPATGIVTTGEVRIGSVPTRSLNLPDSYSFDGWGNRFIYAVTRVQATDNFEEGNGRIDVVDSGGNSVVDPTGTADYVIYSAGPNGLGAYNRRGTNRRACGPVGAGASDHENCNDNDRFMATLLNREGTGAKYDDVFTYKKIMGSLMAVPTDAVIPFNTTSCPAGWTASVGIPAAGGLIYCERN